MVNGEWRDVYKDPIDAPDKKSKRGRQALIVQDGEYKTVRLDSLKGDMRYPGVNKLVTVFRNGALLNKPEWADMVERARK